MQAGDQSFDGAEKDGRKLLLGGGQLEPIAEMQVENHSRQIRVKTSEECARAEAAPFRGAEPCGRNTGAAGRRAVRRRSPRGPLCLPQAGTGPRGRRGQRPRRNRASPDLEESRDERVHPEPSRGRRRRHGGRGRPAPGAGRARRVSGGQWPKRGRPSPSGAHAPRGQMSSGAAAPRPLGSWADRGSGGKEGRAHGGNGARGKQGRARGERLWAFTSSCSWHTRDQRRF